MTFLEMVKKYTPLCYFLQYDAPYLTFFEVLPSEKILELAMGPLNKFKYWIV